MPIYEVSYDLIKEKNYTTLIAELKRRNACKVMLSQWWVNLTITTAKEVYQHFQKFGVDSDDRLLVVEIDPNNLYGITLEGVQEWLDENA